MCNDSDLSDFGLSLHCKWKVTLIVERGHTYMNIYLIDHANNAKHIVMHSDSSSV